MSEALKNLNNIRTLRAQSREVSLETLEEMLEKLVVIVEERREEESSQKRELEEKEAKLAAFRQKLLDEGIDPTELLSSLKTTTTKRKSVREPRPAKYKYIDEDGSEKTWTGQGRTPKAITAAIKQGKKLEDFAI
ncbi:H-NS family histone-like protein [Phytobacter sp. AG2a]|jgi:DNA-binding protein H-NS